MTKKHWEKIYKNKEIDETSWYQENPEQSLNLISSTKLPKESSIIDVGGGESLLANKLIESGYRNITVLDISSTSIRKVKKRLGRNSKNIEFVLSDILEYDTSKRFDVWHDRATFHFLINELDIKKYVKLLDQLIKSGGYLIIATFSTKGPDMCSGLDVKQYSKESMKKIFNNFRLVKSLEAYHRTPSGKSQKFIYCMFKKK